MSDTRKVRLEQGPEGSPNFCFGTYDDDTGEEIDFVQSDTEYAELAYALGADIPDPDEIGRMECISKAFDWLNEHAGEVFELCG